MRLVGQGQPDHGASEIRVERAEPLDDVVGQREGHGPSRPAELAGPSAAHVENCHFL